MKQVSIVKGHYRNRVVSGVFELIKPFQSGARGGFVTIRNPNPEPKDPPVQRILVEESNFTLLNAAGEALTEAEIIELKVSPEKSTAGGNYEQAFTTGETDDDAMSRISDTFSMLDKVTDACATGIVRGLVVSGPPGIGKSFGVERQLKEANMMRIIKGDDPRYEIVSGGVSSIGLYKKLYYNRSKEQVLVVDDMDAIFTDEECLNLMKAALNSGDKRRLCWNKESRTLLDDDIPNAFDFEGSIIFLSNIDFEASIARGSRIAAHLEALMSRCHYLDLRIGSVRDKLLRIKQVIQEGMLDTYNFTKEQETDVVDFTFNNAEHMREISLRAVKKLADLVKMDPIGWYVIAEATLLHREATFKRLLDNKQRKMEELQLTMMT